MKIRLIITDRSWEYLLHVAEQQPGKYYVTLRAVDGARLMHAPCLGPINSLDAIRAQADPLYLRLQAMFQEPFFPAAPARDISQITKPTTAAETETTAPALQAVALSGHPGIDRCLE